MQAGLIPTRKGMEPFAGMRYPSPVTRIFIILLIVLLPLRGWTAERMANHMAANAMPADCPMMMLNAGLAEAGSTDDSGATPTPTERTCQSCQLCMALASPEMPIVQAVGPVAPTVVVHRSDSFASAEIPPVSKPPIS